MRRSEVNGRRSAIRVRRPGIPEPHSSFSSAFTLVELLAVIGIIVLLAGIIIGSATYANRKALESRTRSQLHQITLALEMYKNTVGYYPTSPSDWVRQYAISHDSSSTYATVQTNNNSALFRALIMKDGSGAQYYEYKPEQIQVTSSVTNLVDPYGNFWGYLCYSGSTNQYNSRSYDLWSFGLTTTDPTNSLICNWRQQ